MLKQRYSTVSKNIHRRWGKKDMLFYCPKNKIVWQYDNCGKLYTYDNLPTYGLERKELK